MTSNPKKTTTRDEAGSASAIRERKRLFALLDNMPVLICLQARDHSMPFVNAAFKRAYGDPGKKPCYEAIWGRTEKCVECPTFCVFDTHKPVVWESVHTDTGRVYMVHDYPFTDVDGTELVLEVSVEITDLKRAEKDRERLQAAFYQSQKMEMAGRLAGAVAHDFNNMVTVIKTLSDMGVTDSPASSRAHEYFKNISLASARAMTLTRKLAYFSRKNPLQFLSMSLNDTIDGSLKIIRALVGENTVVKTELDGSLWQTRADRGAVEQVLMNLVFNAREALPAGGTLSIRTKNVDLTGKACFFGSKRLSGRFVSLVVEDTGTGMDEGTLSRIAEPFFTTKGDDKGVGLGFPVVYGIVESHGGCVDVESAPGKGTTVRILLPALERKSKAAMEDALASASDIIAESVKGGILLVEDDELVSKSTDMALSRHGYGVVRAASAEEALLKFTDARGGFKLLITDIVLPGRNGVELAEHLSLLKPGLRVILLSGYASYGKKSEEFRRRGFKFIIKPYEIADLVSAVEEAMP
jgi:signal transduction histidine kinase/ActR/RegA family two-component response regulator